MKWIFGHGNCSSLSWRCIDRAIFNATFCCGNTLQVFGNDLKTCNIVAGILLLLGHVKPPPLTFNATWSQNTLQRTENRSCRREVNKQGGGACWRWRGRNKAKNLPRAWANQLGSSTVEVFHPITVSEVVHRPFEARLERRRKAHINQLLQWKPMSVEPPAQGLSWQRWAADNPTAAWGKKRNTINDSSSVSKGSPTHLHP